VLADSGAAVQESGVEADTADHVEL
jgi:hypothetical protein